MPEFEWVDTRKAMEKLTVDGVEVASINHRMCGYECVYTMGGVYEPIAIVTDHDKAMRICEERARR